MTRFALVTKWVQELDGGWAFASDADFAIAGIEWSATDVTVQPSANLPPNPNVTIIEVETSAADLAAIKAHAQYGNAAVLWEGDPQQSPVLTTNAYNALVTFLANKFNATENQVRNTLTSIGVVVDGVLTRYQAALLIIGWLRERPKQTGAQAVAGNVIAALRTVARVLPKPEPVAAEPLPPMVVEPLPLAPVVVEPAPTVEAEPVRRWAWQPSRRFVWVTVLSVAAEAAAIVAVWLLR